MNEQLINGFHISTGLSWWWVVFRTVGSWIVVSFHLQGFLGCWISSFWLSNPYLGLSLLYILVSSGPINLGFPGIIIWKEWSSGTRNHAGFRSLISFNSCLHLHCLPDSHSSTAAWVSFFYKLISCSLLQILNPRVNRFPTFSWFLIFLVVSSWLWI